MSRTQLKKLHIKRFRALSNVDIEFGTQITAICGKNGTSKSSILGIAAQIFSFEKDYVSGTSLNYQTVAGAKFKSLPAEHFRFSDKFDVPGSLEVSVELFDAYTGADCTAELELAKRGKGSRPVVRKNSSVQSGNASRNFTHPVVFLSLKRLLPIADRDYKVSSFQYVADHSQEFIGLSNELLNKSSSAATTTAGSISSAVAHSSSYDQDSVSAGEDNAGQIVMALMSFRKLREEYGDYKGGLLLIDEADAGLFPAAQAKLVDILARESQELGLQVVVTSHSPTLIEHVFELSRKYRHRFKTIYLSDTYGKVQSLHDQSWLAINADLHTKTIAATPDVNLPEVNVYFEDREGYDLFNAVLHRHPAKKFIKALDEVSLGCSNYIQLAQRKIPEFSTKSLICLDADVTGTAKLPSILLLPGSLPPDQQIFEFLYNLPPHDPIWVNSLQFTRPVFTNIAGALITSLSIPAAPIDLPRLTEAYRTAHPSQPTRIRELFKQFYNEPQFQAFLRTKPRSAAPWGRWASANDATCKTFRRAFVQQLANTMEKGYGVDSAKLVTLRSLS